VLQGVRFFAGAAAEALPIVAAVLEPLHLAAEQQLFARGDPGDCMFIITAGRLRVHDGPLTFNHLGPGDVVGEMAVLDTEPRSATVTAVEPTDLLHLRQETLYALLERHVSVARGVIQVLSKHLRNRVRDVAHDYAYISQVHVIAEAARAIDAGVYRPESLDGVAQRDDALGELARTFQLMAADVIAREHSLRREVQALRIEIDRARQQSQVAEITTSDYFRQLQQRAASLRATFGEED
jgi:CRP/FNR family transcriptional regulator, cyclic AMP receptor protein